MRSCLLPLLLVLLVPAVARADDPVYTPPRFDCGATCTQLLTVSTDGGGQGTVTAPIQGEISCPVKCSATYELNGWTTIEAHPGNLASFAGWGGACAGVAAANCTVTMSEAKSVVAHFTLIRRYAIVAGGIGAVEGAGHCEGTCGPLGADDGTVLHLTATPKAGWYFEGWGGPCSGTQPTCDVRIDRENMVILAHFKPLPGTTEIVPFRVTISATKVARQRDVFAAGLPVIVRCSFECTTNSVQLRLSARTAKRLRLPQVLAKVGAYHQPYERGVVFKLPGSTQRKLRGHTVKATLVTSAFAVIGERQVAKRAITLQA